MFAPLLARTLAAAQPLVRNPVLVVEQVRTRTRLRFQFPSETKRVRKHGWLVRLSTANGKRVIMARILKGKHVLSH